MDTNQVIAEVKTKLERAKTHFRDELTKLRTGRAHPSMLDGVMVEAYGQPMPLKAVASILAPESQLLQITPFDTDNLQAIANAIRDDKSLGLTPTDDGRVVRIALPPMTSENRETMVKVLHQKVEDCLVSARQARHEAFRKGVDAEKAKQIGKDDRVHFEKQIDELMAKNKAEVEALAQTKEQEIRTV